MTDYSLLRKQAAEFGAAEPYYVPLLSNAAALLWHALPDINWAGFYFMRDGSLLLGPFQGKPACLRIEVGRGVCGTAVKENRVLRVADVHAFPGHIACDCASRSEIVVPIRCGGAAAAVLDIDSPLPGRFSETDEQGLCGFAAEIEAYIKFA